MAIQYSSINQHRVIEQAVARTPVVRPPSTRKNSVQNELAASLGAATAPATTATGGTTTTTTTTPASSSSLLTTTTAPTTPTAAAASSEPPTAESAFGPNPWLTNPTGSGPTGTYSYNPYYFATPQTAATVASLVGGQVVALNNISGGDFTQNQPNQMVQLPNGALINAGLVASFYTHGYSQSMVNQMITNEVANVSVHS